MIDVWMTVKFPDRKCINYEENICSDLSVFYRCVFQTHGTSGGANAC